MLCPFLRPRWFCPSLTVHYRTLSSGSSKGGRLHKPPPNPKPVQEQHQLHNPTIHLSPCDSTLQLCTRHATTARQGIRVSLGIGPAPCATQ